MHAHRQVIVVHTPGTRGFVNLTADVEAALAGSGIREGLCLVASLHNTGGVFVTEDEPGLRQDLAGWLEELAPSEPGTAPEAGGYLHNLTGEENGGAHLKRLVVGRGVTLAVTAGRLELGPMERILYGEFDGQRDKRVLVKLLGY
jgi:secondary thiamine-phosphate synthase enzyme